jgi:hypothetical protein
MFFSLHSQIWQNYIMDDCQFSYITIFFNKKTLQVPAMLLQEFLFVAKWGSYIQKKCDNYP